VVSSLRRLAPIGESLAKWLHIVLSASGSPTTGLRRWGDPKVEMQPAGVSFERGDHALPTR